MSCPLFGRTGIPALRASAAAVGRAVSHWLRMYQWHSEDMDSVLASGHQMLDFYAKAPFYANMFTNTGLPSTDDQGVSDDLVEILVISGNEAAVAARFTELLEAGLDELMVSIVPTAGEGEGEGEGEGDRHDSLV